MLGNVLYFVVVCIKYLKIHCLKNLKCFCPLLKDLSSCIYLQGIYLSVYDANICPVTVVSEDFSNLYWNILYITPLK